MDWKQVSRIALPVVAGIALLVYQFAPAKKGSPKFQERYAAWMQSPKDEAAWGALQEELSSLPEGAASPLAQQLILHDKLAEAEKLAREPLQHLRREAPPYAVYAQTTFLIAEGRYQDALEQAVRLNEAMEDEESLLCAYNKLRIASLQKALGNRPGERAAWEELRRYLEAHPALDKQVSASIQENGVSLQEYIKHSLAS